MSTALAGNSGVGSADGNARVRLFARLIWTGRYRFTILITAADTHLNKLLTSRSRNQLDVDIHSRFDAPSLCNSRMARARKKRDPGQARNLSGVNVNCRCSSYSVGAKATPRNTSPACADRSVVKIPRLGPAGGVVANKESVTFTSLLGSAPVSPFELTVEVMA